MVAAELHPKIEIPYPDVHVEISFIFDHTATYSAQLTGSWLQTSRPLRHSTGTID